MLLKNRIALITGAASARGIGRATAELFAEHGAKVAILDIDAEGARAAAKSLKGRGHLGVKCDVTKAKDCERATARALKKWGRIDILVNNAGIAQPLKIMEIDQANFDKIIDINLRGMLLMSQAVIPTMRAQKSGTIVNLASVAGQRGGGIFGGPHYAASKAGILGLTKATARELAPDNIRVNAICPSFIATDIAAGQIPADRIETIIAGVPMGRAGEPHEVAGCALFLASDLSTYVTGTEVDVNGGSHIH